eukprot:3590634-Amphidinium_carterae.1
MQLHGAHSSFHYPPDISRKYRTISKYGYCRCRKDHDIVGCMLEGCDHYWCRIHALKVDGGGALDGIS